MPCDESGVAIGHFRERWPAHAIVVLGLYVALSMAVESSQQTQGAMLVAGLVGAGIASEVMLALSEVK